MAEQEKKTGKILSEEAIRRATQSMKGTSRSTDFNEWDTPLKAEIVDELHRRLRKLKES